MGWIPGGLLGVTVLSCADFKHMKIFYFVQKLQIYSWECRGELHVSTLLSFW